MATEKRLIDANTLLKAIEPDKVTWRFGVPITLDTMFDFLRIIINEQPSVDAVEVMHGRWIEILTGQNSSGYECSVCKRIIAVVSDVDLREKVLVKKYPYCHCGAKMDGG